MPLPPKFYVIVSNGMAYELNDLKDSSKFPYAKYFIKRLHSIAIDKSPEFTYIFINKEGNPIDTKIKDVQIQSVRWNNRRWIITLIDHRDKGYENFVINNAPDFPELNVFTECLFPKINEIMNYKNLGEYDMTKKYKKLKDKIQGLSERIDRLEKLKDQR